jgi:guanyl-specific ribonuclease Sa
VARYTSQLESSAALAVDTGFAWLRPVAGAGCKLRRVTIGCVAGAGVPTSQQLVVALVRTTNAGTTPGTAIATNKLDPNAPTASCSLIPSYATSPTVASADAYRIAFNSQSGADLPWELLEEFIISAGTTDGIAFINRDNALPASHKYVVSLEWEE